MEEEENPSTNHGTLQETKAEEGRDGESSNDEGYQPDSMPFQAGPPSSLERQGEDGSDKKPSGVSSTGVEATCLSGENRHNFAYAVESLKAEDLPEFVKQHDNTLSFPEKVRNGYT